MIKVHTSNARDVSEFGPHGQQLQTAMFPIDTSIVVNGYHKLSTYALEVGTSHLHPALHNVEEFSAKPMKKGAVIDAKDPKVFVVSATERASL